MTVCLTIEPRDAFIARDGRPFGLTVGQRMKSLDWVYPSVLAGSLRTLLGKKVGGDFGPDAVTNLKSIEIAGPLPEYEGEVYLPSPKDYVLRDSPQRAGFGVRPSKLKADEGCDLPRGLSPVLLPESAGEDFKPGRVPAFWSMNKMTEWLMNETGSGFESPPASADPGSGFLGAPIHDDRIHVTIDAAAGVAEEGKLFLTAALAVPDGVSLAARVDCDDENACATELQALDTLHPLGGERRLMRFRASGKDLWGCPDEICRALAKCERVRMVLASPALFEHGWKPGWLDEQLEGSPPGSDVILRLVGASIERWYPVSGWSLEPPQGPKAVRRLTPAGSVYFFEVANPDKAATLGGLWLRTVSDDPQCRRDGFGLAMWGPWSGFEEGKN
jgi:CRISPR-associated protein Cmr3